VVRDFAGFRTYDSLQRLRHVFGQEKALIVTQEFHLPRSLFLARAAGVDAVGIVADRRSYQGRSIRRSRMREIPACWAALIDVWTGKAPKMLGPPEGLDGDAQTVRLPEQAG
jgi:SanA protein